MKKQHIVLVSVLVVFLVAGGILFFAGKKADSPSGQRGAEEKTSISSLRTGDSVNIFADDSLVAERIVICDDSGCGFSGENNRMENLPSEGDVSRSAPPSEGKSPDAGSIISGTITSVGKDFITVDTDNGETKTISVSDSTKIFKK